MSTVRSLLGPQSDILAMGETRSSVKSRFANIKAAIAAPTPTDKGSATQGRAKLHLVLELPDAGTSFDLSIWIQHDMTGKWTKLLEKAPGVAFGTAGVLSVADTDGVVWHVLEIDGAERVAIEAANLVGVFTLGADLWLGGVGGFGPADR